MMVIIAVVTAVMVSVIEVQTDAALADTDAHLGARRHCQCEPDRRRQDQYSHLLVSFRSARVSTRVRILHNVGPAHGQAGLTVNLPPSEPTH
jgi:hypothetical protein